MNIYTHHPLHSIATHPIHPQNLLRSLMLYNQSPCNCASPENFQERITSQLNNEIRGLKQQMEGIRAQILDAQKLLRIRGSLHKELDVLGEQRQKIQWEISSIPVMENSQKKQYLGYYEMNQRLRRRIAQVSEFVQRMKHENMRLQEGIISNSEFIMQKEQQIYLRRRHQQFNQATRLNRTSFQSILGKMHRREQQAWRRVREQQQYIERHNLQVRKAHNMTYYSPKARTYNSPT